MKVSVVIPCFNEAGTIEQVVRSVMGSLLENEKEIIIVDDCSTDGTKEIVQGLFLPSSSRIIYHEKNQGKGACLRSAFAAVTGDVIIIQDADLEYDPEDYEQLFKPIKENRADVVYGSRFVSGQAHRVVFFWHYVGNKLLTLLSNMSTNLNLTDMETCYKVFRREVIQHIHVEENRFGIEPEITAKVAALGCRVYEVGIAYYGRSYAQGKKIDWKDGLWAVWCILKYGLRRKRSQDTNRVQGCGASSNS